ncbi:hypothetical protein Hdeb2414_s0053g00753651 [Helianthus debilis subsp. tardiflorus]
MVEFEKQREGATDGEREYEGSSRWFRQPVYGGIATTTTTTSATDRVVFPQHAWFQTLIFLERIQYFFNTLSFHYMICLFCVGFVKSVISYSIYKVKCVYQVYCSKCLLHQDVHRVLLMEVLVH